jgi:DNA-binding NarL/FixJ family response regulator
VSRAGILLADDHELFREGLAGLIAAQPDLEVAGQASDGLEALTLARDLKPALIIMYSSRSAGLYAEELAFG